MTERGINGPAIVREKSPVADSLDGLRGALGSLNSAKDRLGNRLMFALGPNVQDSEMPVVARSGAQCCGLVSELTDIETGIRATVRELNEICDRVCL